MVHVCLCIFLYTSYIRVHWRKDWLRTRWARNAVYILFAVRVTLCVVLHLSSSVKVYSACTCILEKCNGYNCILCILPLKSMYVEELHTCDALHTQNKQNLYHSLPIYGSTCKLECCMWTSFWVVVAVGYNTLPAADGVPRVRQPWWRTFISFHKLAIQRMCVHVWWNDEFEQSWQRRCIFM